MEFRAISALRNVLTEVRQFVAWRKPKQEIWIFVYWLLAVQFVRCFVFSLGAPLTGGAAARDSRPKWHSLCSCECYDRCCVHNLWLWLLKARMMSPSEKINKNYIVARNSRCAQIYQDGECETQPHTHAYPAADGRFEWKVHYSYQRSAIRENYGQNGFLVYSNVELVGSWLMYNSQLCRPAQTSKHAAETETERHSTLRDIVIYKWAKC